MIPEEVSVRASKGDHDAQMELAKLVTQAGVSGDMGLEQALTLALTWSGMAANSGRAAHLLGYAGVLLAIASQATPEAISFGQLNEDFAHALAIVEAVAEQGHERAAAVSFALASHVSPEVIARAQDLKPWVGVGPLSDSERHEDLSGLSDLLDFLGALGPATEGNC